MYHDLVRTSPCLELARVRADQLTSRVVALFRSEHEKRLLTLFSMVFAARIVHIDRIVQSLVVGESYTVASICSALLLWADTPCGMCSLAVAYRGQLAIVQLSI